VIFPGTKERPKGSATLSAQITRCIQKATGLRINVHQFRHAAAAIILRARPGDYEYVRRILGHKTVQITRRFYIALDTPQASRVFARIVRDQLEFGPDN
jgi:integrase